MKKLTIVTAVLAAAVVVLFILHFTGGRSTSVSVPIEQGEGGVYTPAEGSIVFVRMDSVLNKYNMYLDLKAEMEEKVKKAQADLEMKGRVLNRDANDFQEKYNKGLLTRSQSQEKMDELRRREQQLMELQQKTSMEIEDEQFVMLNRIGESINTYIEKYNQAKNYSLIINTTGSSTVLWGNSGLDITNDVLVGLNAEYANSLKGGTTEQPKDTTAVQ